ncbi:sensor histidine kinase [Hahella sp. NBU794]|uniref:sensor histidine kinase n=1 Tax=Hahella sp. NBU794 TaxID=3422590 RepID=UPI003D6F6CFF
MDSFRKYSFQRCIKFTVLVALFGFAVSFFVHQYQVLANSIKVSDQTSGLINRQHISVLLGRGNFVHIEDALAQLVKESPLLFAYVLDADGKVAATSNKSAAVDVPCCYDWENPEDSAFKFEGTPAAPFEAVADGVSFIRKVTPVLEHSSGEEIGSLVTFLVPRMIKREHLVDTLIISSMALIFILSTGVALSLLLSRALTAPVRELTRFVDSVDDTDAKEELNRLGSHQFAGSNIVEIRQLLQSFLAYREKILDHKNILEAQVRERTHALEVAVEENRMLGKTLRTALEGERKLIAQEIHDNFNATLVAIKMYSQKIEQLAREGGEDAQIASMGSKITSIVTDAYSSARSLVSRLRPEIIDTLGLGGALEELVNNYNQSSNGCSFMLSIGDHCDNLDEERNIGIYRIVQEAVTNAVKHASAKEVAISLHRPKDYELVIQDDGVGFKPSQDKDAGIGLISMRERAMSLGGRFESENTQAGARIKVSIPA